MTTFPRILFATVFPLLLFATVLRAEDASKITKGASVEGITEYTLSNGLKVLLYPDPSKPTVTVNLTILVGSRHEGYGETGMAHLLEHLVFKGTPSHPQVPKVLQAHGARFNGTTWVDRTNYFETLPASDENLAFALKLEADRMVNSFIRQEDLLSEMTVVRNEFERGENSPQHLLNQRLMSVAYDWHNYGKSTIGNRSDIERVPIKNLQAFYKKYYQPDNALLVVAGKFDSATALKLIDETFGVIPKPTRLLDKTYTDEPPQDGERSVTLRRVGELGLVGAVYHVPSGTHEDAAALDVLARILETPPAGRLYKALVETHKATSVNADFSSWHDAGVFEVGAEVRKGDSLDAAKDALLAVTEGLAKERVTKEEVERAKQRILKNRELMASDTSAIAVGLSNWASQGDWRLYFLHRDRIEKVTPEEVQAVAAKYLKPANRTSGTFVPTDETQQVSIPARPDLAKLFAGYQGRRPVVEGESFDISPANIESRVARSTLSEGLKVVLLPKQTRGEAVKVQLVLRYGSPETLRGYETAADYLPPLMMRGTKKLSRQQIQDALDKYRATLSVSGDVGTASFSIETTKPNLPAVLDLLKQILREPTLSGEEFEVLRRQQLAALEEQLTDPQSLAATRLRRTVSPYESKDVRYIPTHEESIARNKGVTLDQIKTLYNDFVSAQAGEIVIVGDMNVAEINSQLTGIFADWMAKQSYARIPKIAFPQVKGSQAEINTPDKANAVYMAGEVLPIKDDHPDYPALVIGNFILGGGTLSSRLGDRVRQKEGLSYGVGSHLIADSLDPRASMTIFAICNPQNIKKVETAIREELERLVDKGITAEELEQARRGYLQQQQVMRANDEVLASKLEDAAFAGRTMAYYSDLEKKIGALTPDDVSKAMKKHIDPKRLSLVTAGDFGSLGHTKATPQ